MSTRWRLAGLAGTLLLLGSVMPAAAADLAVPTDAAAPGGRLVVTWRGTAPATLRVAGVSAVRRGVDAHRTVVVARAGSAGSVAVALRHDPRVITVVPDAVLQEYGFPADPPNDMHFPDQTDLEQIHVPEVWPTTTGSPSVVVAFIDTGVDLGHPDLAGVNVVAPRDETFNNSNVSDPHGHGTHTAGTVFARPDNQIGIAGIAPNATLMPIKINVYEQQGFFSDLLDGVDWARTHGANIVSMSVGSWLSSDQVAAFQPVFTAARQAGILLVAAAGNDGTVTRSFPAALDGVVSVGAVDKNNVAADFSTRNSAVDIAAPGVDTLSLSINDPSGYERMSGTSMATPHVAGVAALVWSARPTLTVDQLEAVLRASARDLGAPGRDDIYGSGLVDAEAALTQPVPNPIPNLDPPGPPPAEEFDIAFDTPAAAVKQLATSYTLHITANHEPSDAMLVEYWWRIRDNACPPETSEFEDGTQLLYATQVKVTDLKPGFCYRWSLAAIDRNDEISRAVSPPVWVRDVTRPWVTGRSPAGAKPVSVTSVIDAYFSEPVSRVTAKTFRVRNLATGKAVAGSLHLRGQDAWFVPKGKLTPGTLYEVTIGGKILDESHNLLVPAHWVFRTRP